MFRGAGEGLTMVASACVAWLSGVEGAAMGRDGKGAHLEEVPQRQAPALVGGGDVAWGVV